MKDLDNKAQNYIRSVEQQVTALKEELQARRNVGQILSNIAFNWGQEGVDFHTIDQNDKNMLTEWRKKWDAIRRAS